MRLDPIYGKTQLDQKHSPQTELLKRHYHMAGKEIDVTQVLVVHGLQICNEDCQFLFLYK